VIRITQLSCSRLLCCALAVLAWAACNRSPTSNATASTYELLNREWALRSRLMKSFDARWEAVTTARTAMPHDLVLKQQAFDRLRDERQKEHDDIDKELIEPRMRVKVAKLTLQSAIYVTSLHRTAVKYTRSGAIYKTCGADGCGAVCGECGANELCYEGYCRCIPKCEGRQCGGDGCGGWCGDCELGDKCDGKSGLCKAQPDVKAKLVHEACLREKVDACAPAGGRGELPWPLDDDEAAKAADKAKAKAEADTAKRKDPERDLTAREKLAAWPSLRNFGAVAARSERIDEKGLAVWIAALDDELRRLAARKVEFDALGQKVAAAEATLAQATVKRAGADASYAELKAKADAAKKAAADAAKAAKKGEPGAPDPTVAAAEADTAAGVAKAAQDLQASAKVTEADAKKALASAKAELAKSDKARKELQDRTTRIQAERALFAAHQGRLVTERQRIVEAKAAFAKAAEATAKKREASDKRGDARFKPAEDALNAARAHVVDLASIPTGTEGETTWPAATDYGQAGPKSIRPDREQALAAAVEKLEKYLAMRKAAWDKVPATQKSRALEPRRWMDDETPEDRAFYDALRDWPKLDRMLEEWIAAARGVIHSNHRMATLWAQLAAQYGE